MFQRNGRFFTHPNLPQGKEQVTPNIGFSPHLSSPEGEGQIPSVVWLSDYQYLINNKGNLYSQGFDRTRVTCISPTGENERGLK